MKNVGRYTITGRLGRGAMSSVYKAQAPITKRTVALKILLPRDDIFIDLVGEKRLRQIFLEEARIMGEITHDHVAKIIDCDEDNGVPFIVLEYFAHSLGSLIGEAYHVEKPTRILSITKAYEYLRQSLLGLERLHFAGIIHRDIKPYNLMITNDDRVKIIDFGLSRVRGEEKMAIPGMNVGSPYYAAPEQAQNPKKADERADIFSLGVLAYRMVTGKLIDPGRNVPPPPSSLNRDLDHQWDQFLLKSISPAPEKRFPTAREMRQQLEMIYQDWAHKSTTRCAFSAQDQTGPILKNQKLRTEHRFLQYRDVREQFSLDALMRPKAYPPHRFEIKNKHLLYSKDTGIFWQREGAGFTLSWYKACEYVEYLNTLKFCGLTNWRLPTVEELATILRPPNLLRDFCLNSYFSPDIHWLWSCDTCTKKKSWTIDLVESFFESLDKDGMASVVAVCSQP